MGLRRIRELSPRGHQGPRGGAGRGAFPPQVPQCAGAVGESAAVADDSPGIARLKDRTGGEKGAHDEMT